jgi:hypothetical protein
MMAPAGREVTTNPARTSPSRPGLKHQAGPAIREQLGAADSSNTGWHRDLSVSPQRARGCGGGGRDLTGAAAHHQSGLIMRERQAAAPATPDGNAT